MMRFTFRYHLLTHCQYEVIKTLNEHVTSPLMREDAVPQTHHQFLSVSLEFLKVSPRQLELPHHHLHPSLQTLPGLHLVT